MHLSAKFGFQSSKRIAYGLWMARVEAASEWMNEETLTESSDYRSQQIGSHKGWLCSSCCDWLCVGVVARIWLVVMETSSSAARSQINHCLFHFHLFAKSSERKITFLFVQCCAHPLARVCMCVEHALRRSTYQCSHYVDKGVQAQPSAGCVQRT